MRLAALDAEAANGGLRIGQSLTEARAMLPGLRVEELDRALLDFGFAEFADWHSNASPLVAVLTHQSSFGDLALDITGVAHLFGGELAMLNTLLARLRALGYAVSGAVGSTIGVAWAVSHFSRSQVIPADQTAAILDGLPVAGLRLTANQIDGLSQMGLKSIGQLPGKSRKALQARFGVSLLERLDQAYGLLAERLVPRLPLVEHYAEHRFADPIGLLDDVLMCVRDLAIKLSFLLEQEGLGAQTFHLFLYRIDHKVMTLSVNSGSPIRDPAHISRLFSNRSERLEGEFDAGFGIDMIRLAASSVSELDASQLGIFVARDGAEDLDRLYDRMSSRLGAVAVLHTKAVNTHIPERSAKLEPIVARTPQDASMPPITQARPLRLLPRPEPIFVMAQVPDGPPAAMIWRRVNYHFVKASPAERVVEEWQHSGQRLTLVPPEDGEEPSPVMSERPIYQEGSNTRDYYIAEDADGRRFWLYRQGLYGIAANPIWFLHGLFA